MKSLLSGMPYKPSTMQQDVQSTWRKHGWKPKGEKNVQHANFGHKHTQKWDDYQDCENSSHLDFIGSFK